MSKRVVIVGASSGIGLALTQAYLAEGWTVGVASRRLQPFASMAVEAQSIDITSAEAPTLLYRLIDRLGGMDLYLHVAGIGYDNPQLSPEEDARMARTNCEGFSRMVLAAYNWFAANSPDGGHIAAVTSVAGTMGIGAMAAYSASKAYGSTYLTALEQLARINGQRITFTDIRPGWCRTPLLHSPKRYPLEMMPESVARAAMRAIARRERVAIIDRRWRLLVGLWRCLPRALWVRLPLAKHFTPN